MKKHDFGLLRLLEINNVIQGLNYNEILVLGSNNLKIGTLIRITNPDKQTNITAKIIKRTEYPELPEIGAYKGEGAAKIAVGLLINPNQKAQAEIIQTQKQCFAQEK